MIDLEATRARHEERKRACAEIGCRAQHYDYRDIDALLAEVMRNTCACGHALADHKLDTGAIVTCRICRDPEADYYPKDCFNDELTANSAEHS